MKPLRVSHVKERTRVLGPGVRTAVWFHGCRRGCPGCVAAAMNASEDWSAWDAAALAERVLSAEGTEGVTLSGGEPFDQDAEALGAFLEAVRAGGRSVMAYTGYGRAELEADGERRGLLGLVDLLVDGPYVAGEDHGEWWRGSANQRFHFLTGRYAELEGTLEGRKGRPLEVELGEGTEFSFTGVPPKGFMERLAERLGTQGLELLR